MTQIEALKELVTERLHAVASEILGAIEKTIRDYEEQNSRLKDENERNRSLLDIIIKDKLPQKKALHKTTSTSAAAAQGPSKSKHICKLSKHVHPTAARNATSTSNAAATQTPFKSKRTRKPRAIPVHSVDLQCVFASRADFLTFASKGNCPYCIDRQATERHLISRHYAFAVHYNENGIGKFVVPCTCKDWIQGRSHWHCPYCTKIIYRKCNFEGHISKQHGFPIHQQSQNTEIDQPSDFKEEVALTAKVGQQSQVLLRVKEEQETKIIVNSAEVQHQDWPQIRSDNSPKIEQCPEEDKAQESSISIIFVDSFIQDLAQINTIDIGEQHSLKTLSTPAEIQPDPGVDEIQKPAQESQLTSTDCVVAKNEINSRKENKNKKIGESSSSLESSKRRKTEGQILPHTSSVVNKSTESSTSHNLRGSHCCKVCGKTFHYIYTLTMHAQTHTGDEPHICGVCGTHLESTESLVQHVRRHAKRNKWHTPGKQFSFNSLLKNAPKD